MNTSACPLAGLVVIDPKVHGDPRGFFLESWNRQRYGEAGINVDFVQDNLSRSKRGTLRGLHFQNPNPQSKLLQVLDGEVFDVAVDLRRSSPTFRQWHGVVLSAENKRQFFVPAGFAHGFFVLSESALVQYKCSSYYSPKDELAVRWDDPGIGIRWPDVTPLLSARDARAPRLSEIPVERLFS
ncbi:MAG: dTDP-4-dehydrorhamnose 3,5-epimerase [Verrucomicrobiota bacterium]